MLAREFYEIGERYYREHGIGIHLVPRKVKYILRLYLDAKGELVSELTSTGKKEEGKKFITYGPPIHVPNEKGRSGTTDYALFINEIFENKEIPVGHVGSPVREAYFQDYLKKHRELIPHVSEEDEVFHLWLDSGLVTTFLTDVAGGGMFDVYINEQRAVELYSDVFEKFYFSTLVCGVGRGLFSDTDEPLRENCSKFDCQTPLFSYNDLMMYENNRPKLQITAKEDAYIRSGWNLSVGHKLSGDRIIGSIRARAEDIFEATRTTCGNAHEIMKRYKENRTPESASAENCIIFISKPAQGRLENKNVIYENVETLFRNIAKFHEDCGFDGKKFLDQICVSTGSKDEYLDLTDSLLISIWQNQPIVTSDILQIVLGLKSYKRVDEKSFRKFLTGGVLNLATCYLKRRNVMQENYMYVVGQIMAKLNRKQKEKEPGRNVIYDLLSNMDKPEQMIGTALRKMIPYWTSDNESKSKDVPEDVIALLQKLDTLPKFDLSLTDKNLCFFLGYANS